MISRGQLALDWGLVNAVASVEACLDEAIRIAQRLVECGPSRPLATTKRSSTRPKGGPPNLRGAQRP